MGTDIHIYAERWNGTTWERLPIHVADDRNYRAFALLADVRNGYGFAGCITGVPIEPIAQPRGIPADTSIKDNELDCDDVGYCWLGDHSHSWVLLSELLAVNLDLPVTEIGYISNVQADKLDHAGILPTEWCGGTNRPDYVRRSWQRPLRESASLIQKILDQFKDEQEPENVRFVFGFDS